MSLLLSRLRHGKPALVRRSSLLLLSNYFSSSSLQTPPCSILGAKACGWGLARLLISNVNERGTILSDKRAPMELVYNFLDHAKTVTIGASHGWVATLKEDGILRLQDDLNPVASDIDPIRISLPPLVTLPHCQTEIITNVSMSSSSPEEEDCVVAVKFLGPQLSFCKPAAQNKPEWTNIRIENPCFYSSRVVFSKKDGMFHIPGSGGHLIGSWDPSKPSNNPKLHMLRFKNLPKLPTATRELLDSCCTSEHLVDSPSTGETFMVKQYKKTAEIIDGIAKMKTEALMVFKLDQEGHAVYTEDIGDLVIFISKSEPFCVYASSFPGLDRNYVNIIDFDGLAHVNLDLDYYPLLSRITKFPAPYYIPPQNID